MKIQDEIVKEIESRLSDAASEFGVVNIGNVVSVGDGVVTVTGLSSAKMGEVVEFESGVKGLILNLKSE